MTPSASDSTPPPARQPPAHPHDGAHPSTLLSELRVTAKTIAMAADRPRTKRQQRWATQRWRRRLRKTGIAMQDVHGGETYTTWRKFFDRHPELAEDVLFRMESDGACVWCGERSGDT